jgi:hypothetical protein
LHVPGDAVVQAAPVLDDLLDHVRGCGATDHHEQVFAFAGECVPEVAECGKKPGAPPIEPREFINEDHLLPFGAERGNVLGQLLECFQPVSWFFKIFPVRGKCEMEIAQLFLQRGAVHTGDLEPDVFAVDVPHQEGLSDAASAVQNHQLRALACKGLLQQYRLLRSSNYHRYRFYK